MLRSILILFLLPSTLAQLLNGSCDDPSLCAAKGTCRSGDEPNTFWCDCEAGYGGDLCQSKCDLRCGDGEKCFFDEVTRKPKCSCKDCYDLEPPGLTPDTNPCSPSPCNNGKCVPFGQGFQCICNNGFGGSFCEHGKDHCENHNCTNGSVCINLDTTYRCSCEPGKTGTFCEKRTCQSLGDVCNTGKCIDVPDADKSFICECPPGFEGEFCTQDKNECLAKNICNNGTCINVAGGFVCDCDYGFTGEICDIPVDTCLTHHCSNGGRCGRLPDNTPVCTCPPGFIGTRCETACPPGRAGYLCTLDKDRLHCGRLNGRCEHGTCMYGFCNCPPDRFGDRCEFKRVKEISNCRSRPCENNSTCVETSEGYSCICRPGFYGRDCERQLACAPTTCANGGRCIFEATRLTCQCPLGYSGEYCEKKERISCQYQKCLNNGLCRENEKGEGKCDCRYGFTGTRCQDKINIEKPKELLFKDLCKHRNCSSLASDGVCNPECNLLECNFDGGDCSGGQKPFSKCLYPSRCADLFANGVCNQECNNEACLYDGLDCQSELYRCPQQIRQHCIERRGDGVCNRECSSIGCGFDGGDCNDGSEALILNDIRIKVQMDPSVFQRTGGETLMYISAQLRATVRIQTDEYGPLVFEWDGENETNRIEMDSKELADRKVLSHRSRVPRGIMMVHGIVLYLEVEEICHPVSTCRFSTAQSIVDMISAGLIKTDGRSSLGLPIFEAIVATPRRIDENRGEWPRNQTLFFLLIGFFFFGALVAGVISKTGEPERSRKRKRITAPVWMPPTDEENDSRIMNRSSRVVEENPYLLTTAKRYRRDSDSNYSQIYPQTLANGYAGEYQNSPETMLPMEPIRGSELPAEQIPLHVEASGAGPIQSPITFESVNQVDSKYRRRVLHWLAGNTNGKPEDMITAETVKCLNAGAEVNARDCDENTALMLAVKARRVRLAVVLLKAKANPTIFNKAERSALHEAVANKDVRMVTNLLTDLRLLREIDEYDRNGMTALMIAASSFGNNQVAIAKLLLAKGAKLNEDGRTRKDAVAYHGRSALHFAALAGNIEMVKFLISMRTIIDKQDEAGRTPVMLAAREGHVKTVRYLVEHGACLTVVDALDKDASHHAQDGYHHELATYLRDLSLDTTRNEALRQATKNHGGRQTMKAVKRAGARKTPLTKDSNALTPPSSEASSCSSNPSPVFFHTNTSTPTFSEPSPDHRPGSDWSKHGPQWYATTTPDPSPTLGINSPPDLEKINGSFYF